MDLTNETVNKMIEWIESSSSFIKGQMPDYIEQYMKMITFNAWIECIGTGFGFLIFFFFGLFCCYKTYICQREFELPVFISMGSFMCTGISVVLFIIFCVKLQALVSIYIAPKVCLLEHLRHLLK